MSKSLVIVESPAKAKTINKYLGTNYVVKSSIGHIRDLPKGTVVKDAQTSATNIKKTSKAKVTIADKVLKAKQQLFNRMGIDPENNWQARYEILPDKQKVITELRKLAAGADTIYLATDLDREGEAIAWHLREVIGGDENRFKRVVFNEITKKAINNAFANPGKLDMNRVNAQQARRFLDRIVGFMVSPLLWQKIARGLSAGRVQSVATKLVVEREQEIKAFIPKEYWELHADLVADNNLVRFMLTKEDGKEFICDNEIRAKKIAKQLQQATFKVSKREDKKTTTRPNPPFITSSLQQAASTRLNFGVKKTMLLAQRLYEAGYITYMRTDSTNLSQDAINMVRAFIDDNFGDKYLPAKANFYGSGKAAQEAHEAIRPSDVKVTASMITAERDAQRLYELIWQRFVACQMTPAQYLTTNILVSADNFELKAHGRILQFDGFTKVLKNLTKNNEDIELPNIAVGQILELDKVDGNQHFTKPPARFSEASLVKELEKRSIGRPSTYASIISTIVDRGYVEVKHRRFYAQKIGEIVTMRLNESFSDLMNYDFTANMEQQLDIIASGSKDWRNLLDEFYESFIQKLDKAKEAQGMRSNNPTATDIKCPTCGRFMQIRSGSTGVFLGCSGYALPPKERCKTTLNLMSSDEIAEDDESESLILRNKERCDLCDTSMNTYVIDENRKLHICGNNPDCAGFKLEQGSFKIKGYDGPSIECDKCGAQMQLKTGRFGKYFGCTNTECKNTRKLLKSGEPAPPKVDPIQMPELKCDKVDDFYVLRDGASGLFLAASSFPKKRETRAPKVIELLPHKDEIDVKYKFLLKAPKQDQDGNLAIIRFSRKNKEHYVQTEVNGKPTGWKAFFVKGEWQQQGANK